MKKLQWLLPMLTPLACWADQTICLGSAVPTGQVVVANVNSPACGSGIGTNALVIRVPGPTETVCLGSPIPAGYVVVSSVNSPACGSGIGSNANVIKKS